MNPTTRWGVVAALAMTVLVPAQAGKQALARAQLLETQEGDLAAAEKAYRSLLEDAGASAQHAEAALRLGSLLWRLDKHDEAKPFLEQAVAAGGDVAVQATAVMQGQNERLAKARALVNRYEQLVWVPRQADGNLTDATTASLRDLGTELNWLGEDAAKAIVELLEEVPESAHTRSDELTEHAIPAETRLLGKLWSLGTPTAATWFTHQIEQSPIEWLRFLTSNISTCADDLKPTLVRFLKVPDPTNEVWRNSSSHLDELAITDLITLASDDSIAVRCGGYRGLTEQWRKLADGDRSRVLKAIETPLRAALRDQDPRTEEAWKLLLEFAQFGPKQARAVFLGEAARLPAIPSVRKFTPVPPIPALDDRDVESILAAGTQLAPIAEALRRREGAAWVLRKIMDAGQPEWTAAGIDAWLGIVALGLVDQGFDPGLAHSLQVARPEQLSALIRTMPDAQKIDASGQQLAQMELPAQAFPALRDVLEAALPEATIAHQPGVDTTGRVVRGRSTEVVKLDNFAQTLLRAIANTRCADAANWLAAVVDRYPAAAWPATSALITMSLNDGGEPAHAGLRKLLVWEGTEVNELQLEERTQVFAELARVGDVKAIPLFARAYEMGLWPIQATMPAAGSAPSMRFTQQVPGIGFLAELDGLTPDPSSPARSWRSVWRAWHAYSDKDLVEAWRQLLASQAADAVWRDLALGQKQLRIPTAVLPVLSHYLPAHWNSADSDFQNGLMRTVAMAFQQVPANAGTEPGALHDAIRGLLGADVGDQPMHLVDQLPPPVVIAFADDARAALHRAHDKGYFAVLLRKGVSLQAEDWRMLLSDDHADVRIRVLNELPKPIDPSLRDAVEAELTHVDDRVRNAACNAVLRLFDQDAVPPLLTMLQDPSDDVRKTAGACLDQLRARREQESFWAQARSGIDTNPQSAAAKLLAQARPGEAKDQRLLAIQSLAVLGAAEALPYLIDWTKDADHDIATAARAAIDRLLLVKNGK